MQEIIVANNLKRADVPSYESLREENEIQGDPGKSLESHQDGAASNLAATALGDSLILKFTDGSQTISEVCESTAASMDDIARDSATEALQFHHTTRAKFLARKAHIMELLRGSSPKGPLSSDQGG
jgi:hypothetical protein